jgi:hypothetical protein
MSDDNFFVNFDNFEEHNPFKLFKEEFDLIMEVPWKENLTAYIQYCNAKITLGQIVVMKRMLNEMKQKSKT